MKIFFMSDTHGSAFYTEKILAAFEKERADRIVLLGDILSSGRWDLPVGYDRVKTAELLNGYSSKITAVRGNCDSEDDNGMLDFDIMSEYSALSLGGKRFFMTHGHLSFENVLPELGPGDSLACGHTHVPSVEKQNGVFMLNPGSAALPKGSLPNTYGLLREQEFTIRDLDGNTVASILF